MNLIPYLVLSVIGLQGFLGAWKTAYNYINTQNQRIIYDKPENPEEPFIILPKKLQNIFTASPTPADNLNSNGHKESVYNENSGKTVKSVNSSAAGKSPALTSYREHPEKCYPTATITIAPTVYPAPEPTCIPRPICLDSNPPCLLMPARDGFFCPPDIKPTPIPSSIACTMDAKECPDGSWVGRIPPTCEFAACPIKPNPSFTPSPDPQPLPDPLPIKPDPVKPKCPPPLTTSNPDSERLEYIPPYECLD